jgi:hypothetical protein
MGSIATEFAMLSMPRSGGCPGTERDTSRRKSKLRIDSIFGRLANWIEGMKALSLFCNLQLSDLVDRGKWHRNRMIRRSAAELSDLPQDI